ncbi:hypothetical protein [Chitinophaga sp.]|uniref:hypothetical protein n=1 Tax=Chitinophaga sp. TaxID=1869181 RepID=UPI0031E20103
MTIQPHASTPVSSVIQTRYDYVHLLHLVQERGKKLYGPQYAVQDVDRAVVMKLITYFMADEALAPQEGLQLHKGLLVCGPVGCGKSSLLHILRSLLPEKLQYGIVSCRNVVTRFAESGYGIIHRYSCLPGSDTLPWNCYCFDDLGLEPKGYFYKSECNVMAEVLFNRYEAFVHRGIVTHLTTNLGPAELEETYGNRLRSRMREMLNLVAFHEESPDKRR